MMNLVVMEIEFIRMVRLIKDISRKENLMVMVH